MRLGLGLFIMALTTGLLAGAAEGSAVGWRYVSSGFQGPHEDHDYDPHSYQTSQYHWPDQHQTTQSTSGPSSNPWNGHSWNDYVHQIRNHQSGPYTRWAVIWKDGKYPGKSYDDCDPDDGHQGPEGHMDTPVPAAALLFGSGLAVVLGANRRRVMKSSLTSETK